MRTARTPKFEAMLAKLNPRVQSLFLEQERRLQDNPEDPRLHLKKLQGMDSTYSLRITRNFRALFVRNGTTAWFFAIGDRKDIYR